VCALQTIPFPPLRLRAENGEPRQRVSAAQTTASPRKASAACHGEVAVEGSGAGGATISRRRRKAAERRRGFGLKTELPSAIQGGLTFLGPGARPRVQALVWTTFNRSSGSRLDHFQPSSDGLSSGLLSTKFKLSSGPLSTEFKRDHFRPELVNSTEKYGSGDGLFHLW
jgi:hypothetical protein